jgi:hypothetical protein
MDDLTALAQLVGSWRGTNKLWLPPAEEPAESQSRAEVTPVAGGKFVTISYTWTYEGAPQDGLLLWGYQATDETATAAWADSFHTGDTLLVSRGSSGGGLDVLGSYTVEGMPAWGWRTVLEAAGESLRVMMYNISPEGEEYPAVEMVWGRA